MHPKKVLYLKEVENLIPAGVRKYHFETTRDIVLDHLKKEKGNPQSIEEISKALNLNEEHVKFTIRIIQMTTDLCEDREGFYFPENKMRWWLAAFGWVIMCTYTFCSLIRYHHL